MRTIFLGLISLICLNEAIANTSANETINSKKYVNTKVSELRSGSSPNDKILHYLQINEEVTLIKHDNDSNYCLARAKNTTGYIRCNEISDTPNRLIYLYLKPQYDYQSALESFELKPSIQTYWLIIDHFNRNRDISASTGKKLPSNFQDILKINSDLQSGKIIGKQIPELINWNELASAIKEGNIEHLDAIHHYYYIMHPMNLGYEKLLVNNPSGIVPEVELPQINPSYFSTLSDFAGPGYTPDEISAIFNIPFHADFLPSSIKSTISSKAQFIKYIKNLKGLKVYLEKPVLRHTIYVDGEIETRPSLAETWFGYDTVPPDSVRAPITDDNWCFYFRDNEWNDEATYTEADIKKIQNRMFYFYTKNDIDKKSVHISTQGSEYQTPFLSKYNYTKTTSIDLNNDGIPDLFVWQPGWHDSYGIALETYRLFFVNIKGEWYFLAQDGDFGGCV